MQKFSDVVLDKNGKAIAGATVTVSTYPDSLLATIYAADGGPAVASVSTDNAGRFAFYAANGHYSITVSGQGITPITYNDVTLFDPRDLAASGGAALVGIAAGGSLQSRLDHVVINVMDAPYNAKGDGVTDDTAAIQAALNSRTNNLTVVCGGKGYKTSGPIYIRGNQKTLDFQGGQLGFDASGNNQSAIVLDNPGSEPTTYAGLKNVYIYGVGTTPSRTGISGVTLKNGILHPSVANVAVQISGGIGFNVIGGPLGGTDTPYYATYTNLKAQFCAVGIYVGAAASYPIITTHTFINPTVGGCSSHGIHFYNAQSCTLISPNLEQNSGSNLRLEKCGEIYSFGGFNEGGGKNVEYIGVNPNFGNFILSNAYPSGATGTGTTPATYDQNPAISFQSNVVFLERIGSQQVSFAPFQTMQLKATGIVTIQTDLNTFARFYLNNNKVVRIEAIGDGTPYWGNAKNAVNCINVYYESGAYYVQNNINSGVNFKFFAQVGF